MDPLTRIVASPPLESAFPLPRLLLIEDSEVLRNELERHLGERFEVTSFQDTAAVVRGLAKVSSSLFFDLVLSDVRLLHDVPGIDLLRRVCEVPFILMAVGLPDVDDAIEALDLGALAYLKKPLDLNLLDAALVRAATQIAAVATHAKHDEPLIHDPQLPTADVVVVPPRHPRQEPQQRQQRQRITSDRTISGLRRRFVDKPASTSTSTSTLAQRFDNALDSMWIAFQPIVDGRSRQTIGFEALMRSREPTMMAPGEILDAAERLERIHELGRCVRARTAVAFEQDESSLLFVNLHAADLHDDRLFDADAPLTKLARRVVLEITERSALADTPDVRRRVASLRNLGFRIAIDDLGAGYAGLTSFTTFEPEIVKLDMSLVRGIDLSPMKRLIVGRITTLCHDLHMRVVAEGIETATEVSWMIDLGCEYLQGFLLGHPAPEARPSVWPGVTASAAPPAPIIITEACSV